MHRRIAVAAVLAVLALAWWITSAEARYTGGPSPTHVVAVTSPTDWAVSRSAVATTDSAWTWAALASGTVTLSQADLVGVGVAFAGTVDTCTVRPIFFDTSSHTFIRVGDPLDFTSQTVVAGSTYPATEGTQWWQTGGNEYVAFAVTALSGTVTLTAGTR
ncbi:MAG: hypothetical protein FD152_681 [Xanthobacteraceae bacterium]|nr:MAG: hypothetical protein FD152_681 [Xanthobacteraceae bacterium]